MLKLAFLQNIQVVAEEAKPRKAGGGSRKEWNPTSGLVIRVWKDGSIFPSQELVDKFDLGYRKQLPEDELAALKESNRKPDMGNGFDVADSQDFPTFKTPQRLLIISPVAKTEGKVDLFGSVAYRKVDEEDGKAGEPLISVMDQGTTTFGKDFLIPAIEEIYGITFFKPAIPARPAVEAKPAEGDQPEVKGKDATPEVPEVPGVEYVDLVLIGQDGTEESEPWTLEKGKEVAFLPKRVSRGEKRGDMTVVRRENPRMYVLYPKQLLESEVGDAPPQGTPVENQPTAEQAKTV